MHKPNVMKIQSKLDSISLKYVIYKEIRISSKERNGNNEFIQLVLPKKQLFIGSKKNTAFTNVINILKTDDLINDEINQFIPELKLNVFHLRNNSLDVNGQNEVWVVSESFAERAIRLQQSMTRLQFLRERLNSKK